MIALALSAPVLGFGLLLTLQWFEERVIATDTGRVAPRLVGSAADTRPPCVAAWTACAASRTAGDRADAR